MLQNFSGRHVIFLCTLCALYLTIYFAHPALPGNNPIFPLGWWGWFDQGEYLKAAKAIANLDFNSSNFYYPPLYSVLGAAFVKMNPMHPFAVLNLASFLTFAHYFVLMAKRYISWGMAVLVFVFTFVFSSEIIFAVWVEPWTTTLVAAIFAFLFFDLDSKTRENKNISNGHLATWGVLGGLIFLTRPGDAVIISPLFIYVLWYIWRDVDNPEKKYSTYSRSNSTLILLLAGIATSALFFLFNMLVHGSLGGRYFAMAETNGFHAEDIFEKIVSLFLDSGPIYNTSDEAIFSKIKWLALVVPATIYFLITGNALIRMIIVVIFIQLFIYVPYSDLLPNGVWRYQNIHYFKWIIPYAGLLIFLWVGKFFVAFSDRKTKAYWWSSLALGLIILSINIKLKEVTSKNIQAAIYFIDKSQVLRITQDSGPHVIDKVSMPNLSGSFNSVYFSANARVKINGSELHWVRDYRFLPSNNGVDLIFIRPVTAGNIEIFPGEMTLSQSPTAPQFFEYYFSFGRPAWLW